MVQQSGNKAFHPELVERPAAAVAPGFRAPRCSFEGPQVALLATTGALGRELVPPGAKPPACV